MDKVLFKNKTILKVRKLCKLLLPAVLLLATTTGCYLYPTVKTKQAPELKKSQEITYITMDVKPVDLELKFVYTAYFLPTEYSELIVKDRDLKFKDLYTKLGDTVKKGQLLAKADSASIESKIETTEYNLQVAKLNMLKAKSEGSNPFAIESAEISVRALEAQLENLYEELEKTNLLSPANGMVVYVNRELRKGRTIQIYDPIVRIVDPQKCKFLYTMSNSDEKEKEYKKIIEPGMSATIEVNGKTYEGKVVMTPTLAVASNINNQNALWVEFDNMFDVVSMGDYAKITLLIQKKENVIAVPKSIVKRYTNNAKKTEYFIPVLEDGRKVDKTVELGMETETMYEIVSGLNVGDKIIVH